MIEAESKKEGSGRLKFEDAMLMEEGAISQGIGVASKS